MAASLGVQQSEQTDMWFEAGCSSSRAGGLVNVVVVDMVVIVAGV